MMCPRNAVRWALLLLLMLLAGGCGPAAQSQSEEEREPHYLAGKARVSSLDYQGAVESFEKALVVNPQSASAHFELGCLFEQRLSDPAEAIYHFQKYLKLRPHADNMDVVNQWIMSCKQELARAVSLGPITEKQQKELEKMVDENKKLIDENTQLKAELTQLRTSATQPATQAAVPPEPVVRTNRTGTAPLTTTPTLVAVVTPGTRSTTTRPSAGSAAARTHTVKAGETPALIARRYGVKLNALMEANPRLDPRRMRVGESLTIPGQ